MADEETSSTRSRSSTRSSTRTSTRSASASDTSVFSLVPTTTPSETALITPSASAVGTSTSLVSSATSTPAANADGTSTRGLPVGAVTALVVTISILVIGVGAFLAVFFMRKRAGRPLFAKLKGEPKRRDSQLQPSLPDSSIYLPSKERDVEADTISKSPSSLDSDVLSPKAKARSSRASSSIFADDTMTVTSRSHYLRPLSLGEPPSAITLRGLQAANGSTAQLLPASERRDSNVVFAERSLSPIPGTPATPGITFIPADSSYGYGEISPTEPRQAVTMTRATRYSDPPTPVTSFTPLAPNPYSFDLKRNSTNTLAPSQYGMSLAGSRPQSMASVYSTQTQNQPMELPDNLSPDVAATLQRLHNRVSTAWSMNSVDTSRLNKHTPAPTEEG